MKHTKAFIYAIAVLLQQAACGIAATQHDERELQSTTGGNESATINIKIDIHNNDVYRWVWGSLFAIAGLPLCYMGLRWWPILSFAAGALLGKAFQLEKVTSKNCVQFYLK